MNDRRPSNPCFVDCVDNNRPYILLYTRDPEDEKKTVLNNTEYHLFPNHIHDPNDNARNDQCEKSVIFTSCSRSHQQRPYVKRFTPYEKRGRQQEINPDKPLKIIKTRTTTVEIDKPLTWMEDKMVEKLLSMVNGEGVRSPSPDIEEEEEEVKNNIPLEAKFDVIIKEEEEEEKEDKINN